MIDHIEIFEDLVSDIKYKGISEDYHICKFFLDSLARDAAYWLKHLSPRSLTTRNNTKMEFFK